MTDWHDWYTAYEDRSTSLSRRLGVVRQRLGELLTGDRPARQVLSLCAGDGRDLIPVLAQLPTARRPDVVLVELDPGLAGSARQQAAAAGVRLTVVLGDAGRTDTWRTVAPVDLLMLCGIFGNVPDDDVLTTIRCSPGLLNPGGAVIWTRGHRDGADLRPRIRGWFRDAGFDELAFDSEPVGYGVGVHRLRTGASAPPTGMPDRLFSFLR
jgi:hypothetical protein